MLNHVGKLREKQAWENTTATGRPAGIFRPPFLGFVQSNAPHSPSSAQKASQYSQSSSYLPKFPAVAPTKRPGKSTFLDPAIRFRRPASAIHSGLGSDHVLSWLAFLITSLFFDVRLSAVSSDVTWTRGQHTDMYSSLSSCSRLATYSTFVIGAD